MLRLTAADHTPLGAPALPLVVAQARFAGAVGELTTDTITSMQSRLAAATDMEFSRVSTLSAPDIIVTSGPVQASASSPGIQLATQDGHWQTTITADSVAVETPKFRSYLEDFRPVLQAALQVASECLRPVTATRFGLRFVNLLQPPNDGGTSADWSRWVHPVLAAPVADAWLREGVLHFNAQLMLSLTEQVSSVVRCGPAENQALKGFLLDIDTFTEPQTLWNASSTLEQFDALNSSGVALFQHLITPEMLQHLKGGTATTAATNAGGDQ